jgi:hypothetical protein
MTLKKILGLCLVSIAAFTIGCSSDSSSSSDQATVTTSTTMPSGTITGIASKDPAIAAGTTCDSIVVTRARIVISAMKLHHDEGDTAGMGTIKAGPFVAEWDSTGEQIISTVTIPPGTYDRIKFEIHKLDDNKDASLLNDPIFGDFVNGGRYTAIIDGWSYVNGVAYRFQFRTSRTENIMVFLNPSVTFGAGQTTNVALIFDPKIVFARAGQRPLDPRDTDNGKDIEKLIKDALKALKK